MGITNDIDKSSPLYKVIKKMFDDNALVSLNENFNTLRYETLVQAADYLYLREKLYSENNDINLFDRNFSSVYSYQSVLLSDKITDSTQFMDNVLKCMKAGEKQVDLMVYFDINLSKSLKRAENRDGRKFTNDEKRVFKQFNEKLKDFIRYNNGEYKLLVIENNENPQQIIEKISKKINEILADKLNLEEDKWYQLYKADIDEYKTPDKYIEY